MRAAANANVGWPALRGQALRGSRCSRGGHVRYLQPSHASLPAAHAAPPTFTLPSHLQPERENGETLGSKVRAGRALLGRVFGPGCLLDSPLHRPASAAPRDHTWPLPTLACARPECALSSPPLPFLADASRGRQGFRCGGAPGQGRELQAWLVWLGQGAQDRAGAWAQGSCPLSVAVRAQVHRCRI